MERLDTVDPPRARYAAVVNELRTLDDRHVRLQKDFHLGILSEYKFLSEYRKIMFERQLQIVKGALVAIVTEDTTARSAAFGVVTSFAESGTVRITTQIAFLRTSGIRPLLSHFK